MFQLAREVGKRKEFLLRKKNFVLINEFKYGQN